MRTLLLLAVAFALSTPAARAAAQDRWDDPYPGVRHLHRVTSSQDLHALVVDLCAPGISLRGTADGERRRTVPAHGAAVGAQAAINGDFFSYADYSTSGPGAHEGVRWGGSDHGYVAPLAFGDHQVELRRHEDTSGLAPWMREVVSGHPTVLADGASRASDDPLCTARHPRTAVGLSADRRTLVLAVVDGRATGRIGMTCAEEAALLRELGASEGLNMDGGGSSTMWLGGRVLNHPSDGSPRVVANHLALFAGGSGPAAHCPDREPEGWIDAATCEGVRGWARDPDADAAIAVHVYFDGGPGDPGAIGYPLLAGRHRDDVGDHGWLARVPLSLMDGTMHAVRAFGIGASGGANAELSGSPASVRCERPPLPFPGAVRRYVRSAEILGAWSFDAHDVVRIGDDELAALPQSGDWPAAPELLRATGDSAVYLRDATRRRHVTSPDVMDAWRLDWGAVEEVSATERDALSEMPAISERPYLVRGTGPAIFVIDAPMPRSDAGPEHDAGAPSVGDGGVLRADGGTAAHARAGSGGCSVGARGARAGAWFPALAITLVAGRLTRARLRR